MEALIVERPESPIAAVLPPAEVRKAWADPGPRSGGRAAPTHPARNVEEAARELVARHLGDLSDLGGSRIVPAAAIFAGPGGHAELDVRARVFVHRDGPETLRAVLVFADPFVALVAATGPDEDRQGGGGWVLLPGGPSVTARADALRLLRAMRQPGALMVAADKGEFQIGPLGIGGDADWWDEGEWRLFEDMATLEEWTGETIVVPDTVDADLATRVAQAALWVRTERIPARVGGPVSFRAVGAGDVAAAAELRVVDEEHLDLGGRRLVLGDTVVRLPIRVVDVGERGLDGTVQVVAETPPRDVELALQAPAGRRLPPRRTQVLTPVPPDGGETPLELSLGELGLEPVAVARAPLAQLALDVPQLPSRSATSVDALLDDLRGA